MSYINLVIWILLASALLIGFLLGFGKKKVASFANLVGLLAAYFLGNPLANGLMNTAFGYETITGAYYNRLTLTENLQVSPLSSDLAERTNQLSLGLSDVHIPKFFQSIFISNIKVTDNNVGRAIASSFAFLTLASIIFLVIYSIVFFLVKFLLGPHGKNEISIFGEHGKNILGRFAGMVLYVFRCTITILGVLCIVVLISNIMVKYNLPALQNWIENDLTLENPIDFNIGKMFYNFANSILGWVGLLK